MNEHDGDGELALALALSLSLSLSLSLPYRQCDCLASFDVLADAVIEIVEGESGMLEAAGDKVFAYDDAAVFAIIDAIAGLEHRADAIIDY